MVTDIDAANVTRTSLGILKTNIGEGQIPKTMKEIIVYGIGFIFVIFMTLGLLGSFDKDSPFKQKIK